MPFIKYSIGICIILSAYYYILCIKNKGIFNYIIYKYFIINIL